MTSCTRCGAASPDGTVFCGDCGHRLDGAEAQPAAPPGHLPEPTVPGAPIDFVQAPPDSPGQAAAEPPHGAQLAPPAGAPRGPAPPKRVPNGTVVDGKYSVQKVIGEGGMGVVYLARDVHTGLEVVLKSIRAELAHRSDVRDRMLAEGRSLAKIDHPNVVRLNAVVAEGDHLWLVMQYIDGESLDDLIAEHVHQKRAIPVPEVLRIFRQILAGIGAAHAEGIVHRDLKPANILIRRKDGVAKVTDFGISKVEEDARQGRGGTKGIIGSLWYMSPEQVTGRRDLDKRVDIYALGILLFEMLVGRVPFDAESDYEIMRMHAETPLPSVSAIRPDVSQELDEAIHKACAKNRDERFATAAEFAAALPSGDRAEPALDERPHAAAVHHADTRNSTAPATRSRAWLWMTAGVGALATGAALVAFGVVPTGSSRSGKSGRASSDAARSAQPVVPIVPASASAVAPPEQKPLERLAGAWVGVDRGQELDAVFAHGTLEFRVRHAAQFDPQDYHDGDARFVLKEDGSQTSVFAVEDHIRPIPPTNASYAPESRGTCQEVWGEAGGRPLRATYDGEQLRVEFAKIEPSAKNFIVQSGKVKGCIGLGKLPASVVVSVLSRPK